MSSVLVLDDREADLDLLSTVLSYAGHQVLTATSGPDALEIARSRRPDLIITDIVMRGMNGYEFVRALRADADLGATPVVFTTANYVHDELVELATACGVSGFIPKPCDPEEIVRLVGKALAESSGPPAEPSLEFDHVQLKVLNNKLVEKTEELERAATERQRLVAELIDAQEGELARVADLLHDEPIQALAAIAIRLDMLARSVDGAQAAEMTRMREKVTEATERLREVLGDLQRIDLEARPFKQAIGDLIEEAELLDGIHGAFSDQSAREPSKGVAMLLFRCAREALMNARKHGRASNVDVTLEADETGFTLIVADDGVGFVAREATLARRGHLGLPALRERLQAAGGSLRVESEPGGGATIQATLPDAARRTSRAPR